MESEGGNLAKHLPHLFPDCYKFFISHFLRQVPFSPSTSPCSPASIRFLPAFGYSMSLPSPSSSVPAQACEPAGMYVLYTFHLFSCDGSVVRDGRSLSGYQLNSQPGTLWQQVPLGNIQNVIIIFLECFTWLLFL